MERYTQKYTQGQTTHTHITLTSHAPDVWKMNREKQREGIFEAHGMVGEDREKRSGPDFMQGYRPSKPLLLERN